MNALSPNLKGAAAASDEFIVAVNLLRSSLDATASGRRAGSRQSVMASSSSEDDPDELDAPSLPLVNQKGPAAGGRLAPDNRR
ncbi:hypothetical protein PR003_g21308 [Phytophthora rubi]|uniref:Uncharacterized protein n=1 Tax=Phytophthora rubi TaxID=129364 RepID=A0A6A3JGE6_9STRA|nr:hypothetical protein PR002_g20496 [Phytophthora rubi]KAE9306160.1 hypothetical protein PR003_g21308 [Phytophthora rubi]